ncbi:unnamed protein product [Agarophyton chilense]
MDAAFASPPPPPPPLQRATSLLPAAAFGARCSPTKQCIRRRPTGRAHLPASPSTANSAQATSAQSVPPDHLLKLFNSLTKQKETFHTIEPAVVRFYSCGPTVYDFAHIGNFRAFLTYDVIKRWLLCKRYTVRHVMNLTDVDDKIIARMQRDKCSAAQLTTRYAQAFFDDLKLLNVIPADHYPRATQHIQRMEHFINGLKRRGHAYEKQGSTYFRVSSFERYGRLAQLDKRQTAASAAAVDGDEYHKEDARDFALWKSHKEQDGDVFWHSSLGKGRPGWHVECSCMAMHYLGAQLDIHAGGIDLVFPHHDNEIAQSEALTGKPFASFWLHNGFVNIDDEKMSKSLGNFRTLRDIVHKPDDARAFRYLVASSHYRSALAFTDKCLESSRNTIKRLDALRARLQEDQVVGGGGEQEIRGIIDDARQKFTTAMDDDLNTPRAAAAMFSVVSAAEKMIKAGRLGEEASAQVTDCLADMDRVFGIFYTPLVSAEQQDGAGEKDDAAPQELVALLERRAEARKARDFERADEIRDTITAAGFCIKDTVHGATLQRME